MDIDARCHIHPLTAKGSALMTAIISPIDGSQLAIVADTTSTELDRMYGLATEAWEHWRRKAPSERGRYLFEAARIIRAKADEIAALETANCGKLIADTRREALRAASCFEYYGGYADKAT
ncbi:MAG: aldehyde dehydrogenase family protein, partial [Ilumatobacteraceae bacterium]